MSLSKNPLIMQSAGFIYTWFLSKVKNAGDLLHMNMLEQTMVDLNVLEYSSKSVSKEAYENQEARNQKLEELIESANNL